MVSIREAQQQIEKAREQAGAAETQLETQRKKLPETTSQRALRTKFAGLQGRNVRRQVAAVGEQIQQKQEEVKEYEQDIEKSEQQLQSYLQTDSGKLQYAKEEGLKPIKYVSFVPAKGWAPTNIPVYQTPYGEVEDFELKTKVAENAAKMEAKALASELGFSSIQELEEAQAWTSAMGGTSFVTPSGGTINFKESTFTPAELKPIETSMIRVDRSTRVQDGFMSKALVSGEEINPVTGRPYGTLTIAPTFGERFKMSVEKSGVVKGSLGFVGSELASAESRFFQKLAKKDKSYSYYINDPLIQGTLTIVPATAAYLSPAGPALMVIGGAETLYKAPTATGKALGVVETGLGLIGVRTQLKNLQLARDIKNAQTVFYSEQTTVGGKTAINTLSKTTVGKEPYFAFTKQAIIDSPLDETIKAGTSRGIVIQGSGKIKPIDYAFERVQPTKDYFLSKQAGEAVKVSRGPVVTVKTDIGQGAYSTTRIKNIQGGYTKSEIGGAVKEVKDGLFKFIGGDKPRVVISEGRQVIRTNQNIQGLIKQKVTTDVSQGGTILQTKGINQFTKSRLIEDIGAARSSALDVAKQNIQSTNIFKASGEGLNIIKSSLIDEPTISFGESTRNTIESVGLRPSFTGAITKDFGSALPEEEVSAASINQVSQPAETRTKADTLSISNLGQQPKQTFLLETKTKPIVTSSFDIGTKVKSATITSTLPTQKFKTSLRTNILTKSTPKTKIIKTIIATKKQSTIRKSSKAFTGGAKALIEIFARRRGKDILIGEAQSAKEAGEFLRGKLKSSLAASGFAKIKGGDKLTLSELGIGGREFGVAKRDSFRVVQQRGFRLGTGSEIREILGTKRSKSRRTKWF